MKYYYNDKLIRTSKTHTYTHALIDNMEKGKIRVIACSSSLEGIRKVRQREVSDIEHRIKNCEKAIKAIEEGAGGYTTNSGHYVKFEKNDKHFTVENMKQVIEWEKEALELINKNWEIVELEER